MYACGLRTSEATTLEIGAIDGDNIRSEDVPALFPQAPEIAPGLQLFALHAADGTPIMLTDSREAAVANAWSQELETLSVH